MEDYNKVLEATEVSENASGTATEKMTIWSQSLTAAQNDLTAAIQTFAMNSNISEIMKLGIQGLTKIIQLLDLLLNKIPLISPLLRTVGSAFVVSFGVNAVSGIIKTSNHISQLIKLIKGAATATTVLGGVSMSVFLGIAAAIGVAVGAGKLFYDLWKDNTPEAKLEQANEKLQESQEKLSETNEKIAEIQSKIKDIDDKGTLSLADEQEKKKLQDQLDLLKDIKKTQEEINEVNQKKANDAVYNDVKSRWNGQTSTDFDKATSDLNDRQELYGVETNDVGTSDAAGLVANIRRLTEAKRQLTEETQNYIASASNEDKQTIRYQNTLGMYQSKLDKYTNEIDENTKALKEKKVALDEDIIAMQNAGKTNEKEYQDLINLRDAIQLELDPSNWVTIKLTDLLDTSGWKDKVKNAIEQGSDTANQTVAAAAQDIATTIANDDSLKKGFADAFNLDVNDLNIGQIATQVKIVFHQMFSEIQEETNTSAENTVSIITTAEENIHNKTSALAEAYKNMNKQGYISETNLKNLLKVYPELSSEMEVTNGHMSISAERLKELAQEAYNTEIQEIQSEYNKTQAVLNGTDERIKAINDEITALLTLSVISDEISAKTGIASGKKLSELDPTEEQDYNNELNARSAERDKMIADAKKRAAALSAELESLMTRSRNWNPTSGDSGGGSSKDTETEEEKKLKALKAAYELDKLALDTKKKELQVLKEQQEEIKASYEAQKDKLELEKDELENRKKIIEQDKKEWQQRLDEYQDAQDAMSDLIDLTEKKLKQQYENEKTRLSNIKDYIGEIQDAVDGVKDNYEAVIDAAKEKLKLDKKAEENQKKITDKAKNIADIQRQLMELEFNDSSDAQAQKAELLTKLNDAQGDLLDEQKSQAYDQAEQSLDDAKTKLDSVFDQIDAAIDGVESVIDKYINYIGDVLMEDGNLATQALKQVDDMISGANPTLLNELYDFNNKYGDHLESTIENAYKKAFAAVDKYKEAAGGTFTGTYKYLGDVSNVAQDYIDRDDAIINQIETDIFKKEQEIHDVETKISKVEADIADIESKISAVDIELDELELKYMQDQLTTQGKDYTSDPAYQELAKKVADNKAALEANTNATDGNTGKTEQQTLTTSDEIKQMYQTLLKLTNLEWKIDEQGRIVDAETGEVKYLKDATEENTGALRDNTGAQGQKATGTSYGSTNLLSYIDLSTGSINWAGLGGSLINMGLNAIQSPSFWTGAIDLISSLLSGTLFSAHEGTNYVSKANSWLDDMLGLGENETARVLEVGEQVIPKGEEVNLTQFDAPFNRDFVTGHPTISNSGNSGDVNIDMGDITANGIDINDLESFLNRKKSEIADYVYSSINKQVKIAGHRNVRGKW